MIIIPKPETKNPNTYFFFRGIKSRRRRRARKSERDRQKKTQSYVDFVNESNRGPKRQIKNNCVNINNKWFSRSRIASRTRCRFGFCWLYFILYFFFFFVLCFTLSLAVVGMFRFIRASEAVNFLTYSVHIYIYGVVFPFSCFDDWLPKAYIVSYLLFIFSSFAVCKHTHTHTVPISEISPKKIRSPNYNETFYLFFVNECVCCYTFFICNGEFTFDCCWPFSIFHIYIYTSQLINITWPDKILSNSIRYWNVQHLDLTR